MTETGPNQESSDNNARATDGEDVRDAPVAGAPSDYATLTEVLDSLAEDGFGGQLVALEGGEIECLSCGQSSPAASLIPRRSRRFEGASDPDDLLRVYAACCPACNVGGTLVLGYGVNASAADVDVSNAMNARDVTVQVPTDAASEPESNDRDLQLDPAAPGAALVDPSLDPVEPNEPG